VPANASWLDEIDQVQRRHPVLAFPHAVVKRYHEDHGGWLGSLIAYYGFFSLFPLLVVFVTVATWVLDDHPERLRQLLESVWSRFPFAAAALESAVEQEVHARSGKGWIVAVGLLVVLWGGVGVVRVTQDAINTIWGVARYERPRFFAKLARGLLILSLLGVGLAVTALVAGLTITDQLPLGGVVLIAVANVVVASAIATAVYRVIIAEPVTLHDVLPGAVIVGAGAYALTLVAGLYVSRVVARLTSIYGPFATTIGLLAYVSLLVQLFVLATEVNVVRARRLWPRSLTGRDLTEVDQRAIELTMRREQLVRHGDATPRY